MPFYAYVEDLPSKAKHKRQVLPEADHNTDQESGFKGSDNTGEKEAGPGRRSNHKASFCSGGSFQMGPQALGTFNP